MKNLLTIFSKYKYFKIITFATGWILGIILSVLVNGFSIQGIVNSIGILILIFLIYIFYIKKNK